MTIDLTAEELDTQVSVLVRVAVELFEVYAPQGVTAQTRALSTACRTSEPGMDPADPISG